VSGRANLVMDELTTNDMEAMQSEPEGSYTRTDRVVAIILAVIAAGWLIAYIVAFVRSGLA
jgi:hypothetical protein